jgi:hypothetical protein
MVECGEQTKSVSGASQVWVEVEQGRVKRLRGWWSRDAEAAEIYAGTALSNV